MDSLKQRLESLPLSSPVAVQKAHSSCQIRSFVAFYIKPFLTTCPSPKAIIGEGALVQHLNPSAPKRCMLSCQPHWHFSDIPSELMHEWWCTKFAVIWKDLDVSLSWAHASDCYSTAFKKERSYSAAFVCTPSTHPHRHRIWKHSY